MVVVRLRERQLLCESSWASRRVLFNRRIVRVVTLATHEIAEEAFLGIVFLLVFIAVSTIWIRSVLGSVLLSLVESSCSHGHFGRHDAAGYVVS